MSYAEKILDILISIKSWCIIILATIFFAPAAILISFLGNMERTQEIARLWGKTIVKFLGINISLNGLENIGDSKSYLIVSNHQSYFDIFVLLASLDLNFKFIAKASLFKIPFLGRSMKRLGYIPIDRENLRSALKSVKKSTDMLKNKTSILIFPEGTRSLDGKLLSFKKGGLNMFLKQGNITVLPVAIKGTVNILRKNSLAVHPGQKVELYILRPIEVTERNKGLASGKEDGLIKTIEEEISTALEFKQI